tara:strand:- start:340 stop:687 length:348 start_codon:yes stop_codon:yes gene_type:complete
MSNLQSIPKTINITPTWKALASLPIHDLPIFVNRFNQMISLIKKNPLTPRDEGYVTLTVEEVEFIQTGLSLVPLAIVLLEDMSKNLDELNIEIKESEKLWKELKEELTILRSHEC